MCALQCSPMLIIGRAEARARRDCAAVWNKPRACCNRPCRPAVLRGTQSGAAVAVCLYAASPSYSPPCPYFFLRVCALVLTAVFNHNYDHLALVLRYDIDPWKTPYFHPADHFSLSWKASIGIGVAILPKRTNTCSSEKTAQIIGLNPPKWMLCW